MNHPDLDFLIQQERRKDILAAAAQSRLAKQASGARPRRAGDRQPTLPALLLTRVLTWLGSLFMSWGCALQSRYAIELESRPCSNS